MPSVSSDACLALEAASLALSVNPSKPLDAPCTFDVASELLSERLSTEPFAPLIPPLALEPLSPKSSKLSDAPFALDVASELLSDKLSTEDQKSTRLNS